MNFEIKGKKLTEKQIHTLIQKGKTTQISGFIINGEKEKGYLEIDENYLTKFRISNKTSKDKAKELICPICRKGIIIKGKKAYGCSRYRENCKFIIPFDILKSNFNTEILTDEILQKMIIK